MVGKYEGTLFIENHDHDVTPTMADLFKGMRLGVRACGGADAVRAHLVAQGVLDPTTHAILPVPSNPLARILTGAMVAPYSLTELSDHWLVDEQARYLLAGNRPDNDAHWQDTDPAWVGRASMSAWHKFLVPRDLATWHRFNVLTFGMVKGREQEDLDELHRMRKVARAYAGVCGIPLDTLILCFHAYPRSSICVLHLHIIDGSRLGPSYAACASKNLMLDDAIRVIADEMAQ